jgi:hypothetical protein
LKKLASIFLYVLLFSCGSDERVDDPIPFERFDDIVININLPSYTALKIDGGHVVIPDGVINAGVRGIIVYRENATTFRAFEQNCSFQPQDACATVDAFALYMQDSCCGSIFNYDGDATGGLAWRPLQQYSAAISGNTLTITDLIIN